MTQPATYDFPPILQGSEWNPQLEFFQDDEQTLPLDLTGYEVDMHVRTKPSADVEPVIVVALSTRLTGEGAGRITFVGDPSLGVIKLHLTSVETQAIIWEGTASNIPAVVNFFYDLELVAPSGERRRVMRGKWPFDAEITRV